MHDPDPDRLPIVLEEWEKLAREKLEDGPYYYVAGGAGSGQTMDDNLQAFKNYKIVQKMLNKVDERDLSVELFGKTYPYPLFQAPIGVQSIIHPEGEVDAALASAEVGVPFIASSASSVPMEQIAEKMGYAEKWFQLYWSKDFNITKSFLNRAESAGYSAIVVTLDTTMMAWREYDLKHVYLSFLVGEGFGSYFLYTVLRAALDE